MAKNVLFPINTPPFQNVDPIALTNLGESLYDGYIVKVEDHLLTIKRPGLTEQLSLGGLKGIQGLYWWQAKEMVIAVADGSIYKITDDSGTVSSITGDKLETTGRPTFADNGSTLVIANGAKMVTTNGTADTAYISDSDAPTTVTHVAFLDNYLLANKTGSGQFYFADFSGAPSTWLAADVFTAESNPDDVVSLYVNKGIIILLGENTTEFWINDGVSPFSRLQGSTIAHGVMATHSTVFVNEIAYFFDDRRRLIRLEGSSPSPLDTSFDETIQAFSTVSDCVSDYVTFNGHNWILFTFPTEDRTLFYDLDLGYWGEWSFWDSGTNARKRFLGASYCYARSWNQHLFGSFQVDKILKMSSSVFGDDGADIRITKRTGYIDHGLPGETKTISWIRFRLKTGVGIGAGGNTEPFMTLRWRDEGRSEWGNNRLISLKKSGDRMFNHTEPQLGAYISRQYEISCSDNCPVIIGPAIARVNSNGI